jgi:glycosyltransferase involved in cell wall biosynthesis
MPNQNKKLNIAQIAPFGTPISTNQNKAIYSHIANLMNELVERKHEVTLFGNPNSQIKGGNIVGSMFNTNNSTEHRETLARYEQWGLLSDCYLKAKQKLFDVIHSHLTIMTGFFSRTEKDTPTLISIHSPIDEWMKPILLKHKDEKYISFSLAQRKQLPDLNWYANIYHGVDTDIFAFEESPEDYVLFIGRITNDKGVHMAINACKEAGIPLRIAGRSYSSESYWHEKIESHIDGHKVRYFGEVSLEDKIPLIQKAKAIVFPTLYNEAFGYVLIEAMSCGTPVIAFNNGSVPEIVKNVITGFIVENEEEMTEAIKKIDTIDRKKVRNRAEQFFSLKRMILHYESVYKRVIQETKFKKQKKEDLL